MRRPLRVLWLIDSLTAGGAEALLPPLARRLERGRVELHACALRTLGGNPFESELAAAGVPVVNLEIRNLRDRAAFRDLQRLLREERAELVHAHLTYASIWGALAARRAGLPLVATLHTLPCTGAPWSRDRLRERLMCRLLRRPGVHVLAVSQALRRAYDTAGRLPAARVEVLHNGIDASAFAGGDRQVARAELGLAPGAFAVSSVAVLRHGKGIEVLLEAAARLRGARPDLHLVIAGDGPLRATLERRAAELGLAERVRWLGFRRDVQRVLAASDAFVLPSRFEAFPTALLEAMAAGLPVIASAVGGVPEILGEPPCGIALPPGSAEALADALASLLDEPAAQRGARGAAACARLEAEFTVETWAERLAGLYERLASGELTSAAAAAEAA